MKPHTEYAYKGRDGDAPYLVTAQKVIGIGERFRTGTVEKIPTTITDTVGRQIFRYKFAIEKCCLNCAKGQGHHTTLFPERDYTEIVDSQREPKGMPVRKVVPSKRAFDLVQMLSAPWGGDGPVTADDTQYRLIDRWEGPLKVYSIEIKCSAFQATFGINDQTEIPEVYIDPLVKLAATLRDKMQQFGKFSSELHKISGEV